MPTQPGPRAFPDGFLLGTKMSAYQVEGSVSADGRGVSIWDTFSHTPGATRHGDTGDVTSDHYRRLDQDLDLVAELGAPAFCFSVAWPRIQPLGSGPPNQRGLDHYRRVVDGLRRRGVTPVLTLFQLFLSGNVFITLKNASSPITQRSICRIAAPLLAVIAQYSGE